MNTHGPLIGAMLALAAVTFAFRFAGPALSSRVTMPPRAVAVLETCSVVVIAALVLTGTLFDGSDVMGPARPAGVLVGGILAWRGTPLPILLAAAAGTTAGLRLLGLP